MLLNESLLSKYGCSFPAKYNKPAIEYYRTHSPQTRCMFIFDMMNDLKDYTLQKDEFRYMCKDAPEVWAELLEAFLYVAYEDVKEHGRKPRNLTIILDDEDD